VVYKDDLLKSIAAYSYPAKIYDFYTSEGVTLASMQNVEKLIRDCLTSTDQETVKMGLGNVIYWGNVQNGYVLHRFNEFRRRVTNDHALSFVKLMEKRDLNPSSLDIRDLKIPYFSGLSFVSKIKMFLNPNACGVIDLQIMKMKFVNIDTIISQMNFRSKDTTIRVSQANSDTYEKFCRRLSHIAHDNFDGAVRVVDVERGLFNLIQTGNCAKAAEILANI
jgi:hypothetical protein